MNKNIFYILIGYLLECYNNSVIGFFAFIIAPTFFQENAYLSIAQASFYLFSLGFFARPFGGALLGYIGDKWGRRIALKLSNLGIAISTLLMGLLPSHETLGIAAPLIFLGARFLQGLSLGGNYAGSLVYIAERHGTDKISMTCSLAAVGFLGGLLATGLGSTVSYLSAPGLEWRSVFIIGGSASLIIFYLNRNLAETEEFLKMSQREKNKSNPLKSALTLSSKNLVAALILGGTSLVPLCFATVYANQYLKNGLHFSNGEILANNAFIMALGMIAILLSIKPISKWGEIKIIKLSMLILLALSLPFYLIANSSEVVFSFYMLQVFLILIDGCQIAAISVLIPKLFSTSNRYSSLGVSFALGQALLGSTTPLVAIYLLSHSKLEWSPALILMASSLLCLLALSLIKNKREITNKNAIVSS